ncbi:MAG: hypothetical protein SCAL_000066 [Candidatus Syntrophoarchaeum caldarius]|uniref:Uncharacterized protein n=1 Tax=Candidatus Syntropharchaeum caldarium TaxID=1838285 RepID=A0A1F2PAF4_9EURY|nr:MAG: hypothetical protein SCAL_000066 [Candidatus Syntrophoarchaeum caldarius]
MIRDTMDMEKLRGMSSYRLPVQPIQFNSKEKLIAKDR